MDNANKIISFVLGLIVVIVFFAIITGRIHLGSFSFLPLGGKQSTTASATPTTKISPTGSVIKGVPTIPPSKSSVYHAYNQTQPTPTLKNTYPVSTIPNTGAPTLLIPFSTSLLFAGIYLRKKK